MRSRIGLILDLLKKRFDPSQVLVKLALRDALEGCDSVLDIGCGMAPTMRELGVKRTVGVEGYAPYVEVIKREKMQDDLVECDVRDISKHFQPRQFDACVAMDLIEHLSKEDGLKLIQAMETIARKRVVFFTPSGFLPQRHAANDDLQAHLSGWEAEEMRKKGYKVIGLLGPKKLRGEYHVLKKRPMAFWAVVSLIAQCFHSKSHPESAAAIMCIKDLEK
jgi:SAM-dependent methyltransferase